MDETFCSQLRKMKLQSCIVLLLMSVISINEISCERALTDDEIQELVDNNFVVAIDETAGTITLGHSGYPEHSFEGGWGNNPNTAQLVNHSYTLPLEATVAETKGCAGGLGAIGYAVSGAVFYNPYTGFGWNAVEGECAEDLDTCWGHPSPDGTYHYHRIPECLYTGDLRDKFLGVALDGYPIYGPMDGNYKNYTSADLDICHGHNYNGRYIYRATFDFPYILSCFHGNDVKNTGNTGEGQGPPQGQGPPPGGPPPGRKRRHVGAHGIHRRQSSDDPCWSSDEQNWDSRTCFVVCQNAGSDLDNCASASNYTTVTDDENSAVSALPSLALLVILHSFVAMIV